MPTGYELVADKKSDIEPVPMTNHYLLSVAEVARPCIHDTEPEPRPQQD